MLCLIKLLQYKSATQQEHIREQLVATQLLNLILRTAQITKNLHQCLPSSHCGSTPEVQLLHLQFQSIQL
jgi:hypothetical protein